MDWSQMGMLIAACVVSAGGVGGIILSVVKFSSDFIADRLSKKYEIKLEKEMEKYKTELSRKEYISKTKFDKEFEMYQTVSSYVIELVFESSRIITALKADYPLEDLVTAKKVVEEKFNIANKSLINFAPFIDSGIYKNYNNLLEQFWPFHRLCQCYINASNDRKKFFLLDYEGTKRRFTMSEAKAEIIELQAKIREQANSALSKLRDYLSSRDVLD